MWAWIILTQIHCNSPPVRSRMCWRDVHTRTQRERERVWLMFHFPLCLTKGMFLFLWVVISGRVRSQQLDKEPATETTTLLPLHICTQNCFLWDSLYSGIFSTERLMAEAHFLLFLQLMWNQMKWRDVPIWLNSFYNGEEVRSDCSRQLQFFIPVPTKSLSHLKLSRGSCS